MWMTLFLSIIHKISEISLYFTEKHDATGHIDLTVLQKCTAIVRQLAYDMNVDTIDGYLKLGKILALECLEYYCACIIKCIRVEFLRRPTITGTEHLINQVRGAWQRPTLYP
jgi:hypothetical protein